ncbi:MAG TPA: aldehyde dehydrogenase family protein [Polyangiaceae bacterium]|nr:aldehyde dehydrogenase family protein [Polyangiaceae bacterium]
MQKAQLLREIRARFASLAQRMVDVANREKRVPAAETAAGEEWFSGPVISLRALRLFEAALLDVSTHGVPRISEDRVVRHAGRTRVLLTPNDAYESVLYRGWRSWVELDSEASKRDLRDSLATFYRQPAAPGRLVLVLGAGNVASIPVLDVLYHSFVEGSVCLLKMSPVNAYLGPLLEAAFEPMVTRGYLEFVYGDGELGSHLTRELRVDAIHITGSLQTHDTVVWGPPGPVRARQRELGEPLTKKRITSELGNVGPVFVAPAEYSDAELTRAAENIAGMLVHNASYNCNAARVLVTARGFVQREELLRRIAAVLERTPTRVAYYPGARSRHEELLTRLAGAEVQRVGTADKERLPWTLVKSLSPDEECPLFEAEAFCPILGEVVLEADDAADFLPLAPEFANERLFGTLNAMWLVPSSLERDPTLFHALDEGIRALRYGTVSVNIWPAVGYGMGLTPWGGFPGATLEDPQSGIGTGHNAALLDHTEKVILEGPLLGFPKPFWCPGHAHLAELGAALAAFEAEPSFARATRAAWAGVRS